jgi:hypothetical protein
MSHLNPLESILADTRCSIPFRIITYEKTPAPLLAALRDWASPRHLLCVPQRPDGVEWKEGMVVPGLARQPLEGRLARLTAELAKQTSHTG